jgi:hypothetical protein
MTPEPSSGKILTNGQREAGDPLLSNTTFFIFIYYAHWRTFYEDKQLVSFYDLLILFRVKTVEKTVG